MNNIERVKLVHNPAMRYSYTHAHVIIIGSEKLLSLNQF